MRNREKKGKASLGFVESHRFLSPTLFLLPSLAVSFLYLQLRRVQRGGEVVEPALGESLLDEGLSVGHDDDGKFFLLSRVNDAIADEPKKKK